MAYWCARPSPLASPFLICELGVDLIVPTPTWSLIHDCMRPRDRLLDVKFKLIKPPLFSSVRTLEKCSGTARYCKKTGVSNWSEMTRSRPYLILRLADGICEARPRTFNRRRCSRRAATAMSKHASCSPGQTDVISLFRAPHRGRTGRVGRAEYRDSAHSNGQIRPVEPDANYCAVAIPAPSVAQWNRDRRYQGPHISVQFR